MTRFQQIAIITCLVLFLFAGLAANASAQFTAVPFTPDQMAAAFPDGAGFFGGGTPSGWGNDPNTPYGTANVSADHGWIWTDNSKFTVDFGTPTTISSIRLWSGFSADGRGMIMQVRAGDSASLDSSNKAHEFDYQSTKGGGHFDDGSQATDFSGWYQYDFAPKTAQFWQVTNSGAVTKAHMPRTGGIQFGVPEPSSLMIASLGLLGLIGLARRRNR